MDNKNIKNTDALTCPNCRAGMLLDTVVDATSNIRFYYCRYRDLNIGD